MNHLHFSSTTDSDLDEIPLADLPLYGDPDRTDPLLVGAAHDASGWLGDEPPSILPAPEPTSAMSSPIWARGSTPDLEPSLLTPAFLFLCVGAGAVLGATAVIIAALLSGILGTI